MKKLKKILLVLFLLFCLVGISRALVKKLLTPTENLNFHSEEDYNAIVLKKEDQMAIDEQTIGGLAGTSYTKYLVVYDREYIGYISDDALYSMGDKEEDHYILWLKEESQSQTYPLRSNYYLSKYGGVSESGYYFHEVYENEIPMFVDLIKNEDGIEAGEKEGLNFIEQEKRCYFQDRATGKKLIEITFLKNKTKFKVLSDKVSEYPTAVLIYLFYLTHYDYRLSPLLKIED
ncbi:hypothetical protein [Enterococcus sp. UD-01]|jgi:hypothetical protein|uniref:hypothetical protein n=1 Tax=Enterococcus sp. UD-01 TaxID=3373911 RepID=UPI003833B6D1